MNKVFKSIRKLVIGSKDGDGESSSKNKISYVRPKVSDNYENNMINSNNSKVSLTYRDMNTLSMVESYASSKCNNLNDNHIKVNKVDLGRQNSLHTKTCQPNNEKIYTNHNIIRAKNTTVISTYVEIKNDYSNINIGWNNK